VKKEETIYVIPRFRTFILLALISLISAIGASAQSSDPAQPQPANPTTVSTATVPSAPGQAELIQIRLDRARALAASHQLAAAATELESIRASAKDEVVRGNSSLLLMGIYLEDGNYTRAESLLEETFKERAQRKDASVGAYFALAGQAVNGARAHLARYRLFGLNVSSGGIPPEAVGDLDRLRALLERMNLQGKELIRENAKANDAFALLEDISGIRTTLARDSQDRAKWETEHSLARARLATLPTEIASLGNVPGLPGAGLDTPTAATAPSTSVAAATTPRPQSPQAPTDNRQPAMPATGAVEVGSLTDKAISKVTPTYPQMARNAGVSGLVRVKVVVDEGGSVTNVVWAEGPMLLRQAAQDALKQWKFQPTIIDGKPVKTAGYVDFGFTR
jgi:TonB family protein